MYPNVLKAIFATGRPGYTYPKIYSVIMFNPGACSTIQITKPYPINPCVSAKAKVNWLEFYLVCGGSDDTNRKGENKRDGASEQNTPPRQLKSLMVIEASKEDESEAQH